MSKKTSPSDFLTDYPYRDHAPGTEPGALQVVSNWCTAGGANHLQLVRDYLAAMPAPRLAAVIKANWRVKCTLEELTKAAVFYKEQVAKS